MSESFPLHLASLLLVDTALWPDWMLWVVGAWLFVLGAVIGSFMNVVVYRLPRGMSLSTPGSRCPRCERPIRPYHNVPVLGWLVLRGRCRDCQAAISPRYPLVEAAVGLLFSLVTWLEIFRQGVNLPARPLDGIVAPPNPWLMAAYHLVPLCILLCAALIKYDRQSVPPRLLLAGLLFAMLVGVFAPGVRPVPIAIPVHGTLSDSGYLVGLAEGLMGAGVGALLGCLFWPAAGWGTQRSGGHRTSIFELALVGSFTGWQAVAGIALLGGLLYLVGTCVEWARPKAAHVMHCFWLFVACLVWIVGWSQAAEMLPRFAGSGDSQLIIMAGTAVAILALASGSLGVWQRRRAAFV